MNSHQPSSSPALRFGLFCKTFAPDIERFSILLESVERHAASNLPFFVSMPRADARLFHDRFGATRFHSLFDEDIVQQTHRRGWRTQQLVKLGAHRADFADAWLWVDSDCYFIRPFGVEDFVKEGKVAAIASRRRHVLDDHEADVVAYLRDPSSIPPVSVDDIRRESTFTARAPRWKAQWQAWTDRLRAPPVESALCRISPFFGRRGTDLEYMPCSVWTAESLRSLEDYMLAQYNWSFKDMINYAPWEAIWVGEWEWYRGAPNRFFIEPPMLHIAQDETILRAREQGLSEEALRARYLGIVLAARHQSLLRLAATP